MFKGKSFGSEEDKSIEAKWPFQVMNDNVLYIRFGRIATKHARSLHIRFWLQAAVRRIANSFRFGMNSGSAYVRYRHSFAVARPFVRLSVRRV